MKTWEGLRLQIHFTAEGDDIFGAANNVEMTLNSLYNIIIKRQA